jgi:type II secretory pathway predicted ATPase ExeA
MVESHFGLRRRAFPATPDHSCYYPATGHERALHQLLQGLNEGEGMVLLSGLPGVGKTLLCHCLIERLGDAVSSAFLTNGHVADSVGLLQAILYDLSLPYEGKSEQQIRLNLTDHLLKNFGEGRRTVLVVDEAHLLPVSALEELRLLANLEARSGKAVQIVLVGQPSLRDVLASPGLGSLRQRLAVRASIEALCIQEAADYLLHHLRQAGGRPEQIFTDEAVELLARNTDGVPRLLNQAGHRSLALAAEVGISQVDAEVALEALALLGLPGETVDDDASGVLLVEREDAPALKPSRNGHVHDDEEDDPNEFFKAPKWPA